jgi:hypothetical protein
MEKSLYTAPEGILGAAQAEEPSEIEIEVVDPEEVTIRADGLEIEIEPGEPEPEPEEFGANLADSGLLDESYMQTLAYELERQFDEDIGSRKDWEQTYVEGLKLLGLKYEERTEPWTGACGVFHPMITEAVVRFQAEAIMETFPAAGPAKAKIIGKETPAKKAAAVRVAADLNYLLTEQMVEFRPEHERMLWNVSPTGSAFKKVYYDPSLGRAVSEFVPAEDLILPYGTSDIQRGSRLFHRMRRTKNDLIKAQHSGFYREVDLGEPSKQIDDIRKAKDEETGFSDLNDDRYEVIEAHVELDLKGFEDTDEHDEPTGIALPYVVTFIRNTATILSIRRNWREEDTLKLPRQHFVHYIYVPGFGAYGYGLFHLIGGFAKSATSIIRQLVDAGTLANLPGGLKSRGLRIKGDDSPIAPGEFRDADVASGTLRDNILPLPYKEPSATLFNLLNQIVEEGRRFAATADMKVSDMSAQAPVGTTLALLERQLKVMTAVQARMHFALKQELKLIAEIQRDYTDEDYEYETDPDVARPRARRDDYSMVEVIPVSDPNAATMSQRVVQYQAVMQMAQMNPDIYDMPQLHRAMLEVLGIKNAEKLVPLPDDMKPVDPVNENMNVLKGKPLKAFLLQDHEAHISAHMALLNDPLIAQLIGQNPRAPQIQAALTAHIAEHAGFLYRVKVEQQLGAALPGPEENLPVEIENAVSGLIAQATNRVLQQNQAAAAQQQAQQQAQDPLVQIQMQELQLKMRDLELKAQKIAADAAAKTDEIDLRREEIAGRLQLEATKLGADIKTKQAKMDVDAKRDGMKIGVEIAKTKQPKPAGSSK